MDKAEQRADLTIVMPVYNEKDSIKSGLLQLKEKLKYPFILKIIYDFESDNTLPVVRELGEIEKINIELIRNKYGRGVLSAIKTGIEMTTTEFVVITMADLSDPPEVINKMYEKAKMDNLDIVCGSRYMEGGSQKGGPFLKTFLSKLAGLSLYKLTSLPTCDATNNFKLYRKKIFENIQIESSAGFELGLEIVVKAHFSNYRVGEVPTSWTDRIFGSSKFNLFRWLPHYIRWYLYALFHEGKCFITSKKSWVLLFLVTGLFFRDLWWKHEFRL